MPKKPTFAPGAPSGSDKPSIASKMLDVRKQLRGTKLWEQFQIQRSFEAFSIHTLAMEIEPLLNEHGLVSSFHVDRWTRNGNCTVIEGTWWIEDTETGLEAQFPGIGEGIDNSDKGLSKAISTARKNAMICALNLGIGKNIEEDNITSEPETPQTFGGHAATRANTYVFALGAPAQAILAEDVTARITDYIATFSSLADLDAWLRDAVPELDRFWRDRSRHAYALKRIIDARRAELMHREELRGSS